MQKRVRVFLGFIGIAILFLSVFFDLLTGKPISIGFVQIFGILFGLILAAICYFWNFPFFKRISTIFSKDMEIKESPPSKKAATGKVIDILVVILFLAIAFAFFIGRWKGLLPVFNLGSDGANVATYAAVLDHPANFANDFVYYTTRSFGFYISIYIPLVQFIGKFTHDYGLAYLIMAVPIIFSHLAGFYFLGKRIYRNRFWAFLLAMLSIVLIFAESSDYWGVYKDPQPRMLFGAVLPWILSLALASIKNIKLRPWTMIVLGLLFYVHPVSAPCIAFAVWLSYVFFKPAGKKVGRHTLDLLLQGLLMVAVTVPFIYLYLHSRDISAQGVDFSTATQLVQSSNLGMYRIYEVLGNFVKILTSSLLLPVALIGLLLAKYVFKQKDIVRIFLIWIVAIFLVSFGITIIESLIDKQANILPIFVQLNRSLRYIIPLLEVLVFLPFALFTNSLTLKTRRDLLSSAAVHLLGLALMALFCFRFYAVTKDVLDIKFFAQKAVVCWSQGNFFCPAAKDEGTADLLDYIANDTALEATFVSIPPANISKTIRYQGLRSVAFESRDLGTLSSTDVSRALYWKDFVTRWQATAEIDDAQARLDGYLALAAGIDADYAVVSNEAIQGLQIPGEIVFSSDSYSLILLNP
jgi:hypothetical protein